MVNLLYYIWLKSVSKSNISHEVYLNLCILYYVHSYHVFNISDIFDILFILCSFCFYMLLWSFYLNSMISKTTSLDLWPAVEDMSGIACRPYDLFL